MQFSTQLTGAFALFLFSLPAIAVQGGAAAQPHPSAAAPISKEQAKQVTDHLKAYYTLADTELQQCGKAKGIAHCLSRGIDLKGKT